MTGAPPVRVRVVDDEPGLVELCTLWLELEGHDVQGVSGGIASLAAPGAWLGVDAAVCDYNLGLPGMDGVDVLEHARADNPSIRCVLWTSQEPADLPRRAFLAADSIVAKGDREGLLRAVAA